MLRDLFSLFPAYAGVILSDEARDDLVNAFPRIRGGDPQFRRLALDLAGFSPHTRG